MHVKRSAIAIAFRAVAIGTAVDPAAAVELITPREAALPNAVGAKLNLGLRGVTRGPKIVVMSPAPGAGQVRSPFNLLLRFETHGGATVDPATVRLTYLKQPAINLTQRVGDWIRPDGIDVSDAEVPPGTHYLRVEIRDSAGRSGAAVFAVPVETEADPISSLQSAAASRGRALP